MPPRSKIKITKSVVDRLQPGEIAWDGEVRGFGIRCQTDGKSYFLKTTVHGQQKWLTIGRHGSPWNPVTARNEALRLLVEKVSGRDPSASQPNRAGRVRVSDLCDRYLREHAENYKKPSSARTDRKNIENHVIPLIGHLPVDEVSRSDIERFHREVRDGVSVSRAPPRTGKNRGGSVVRGGPGVANRCVALLSKMFNLAERWGLRPQQSNPAYAVPRYRENQKERFLSPEEFERLHEVLGDLESRSAESPFVIAAIRLLMYTGARLGEVLTLKWSFVDLDRDLMRLPDSKTGAKTIPLNASAKDVISSLPRLPGNPHVIVGGRDGSHLVNLQKPWRRIRNAAGLDDVRIHDLRHSFASVALAHGVPLATVGKLLGHARSSTTERYAHLAQDHLHAASEVIGSKVSARRPKVSPGGGRS